MILLLSGYLGQSNLGDELILSTFRPSCGIPSEVLKGRRRSPCSVFLEFLRRADACLVFPGGEVFQDRTSLASLLFYAGQVLAARLAGRRVFLLFQGWPQDLSVLGRLVARWVFGQAEFVSFRDRRVPPEGLPLRREAMVSADPVFLLRPVVRRRREGLICALGRPKDRHEFAAWPRLVRLVRRILGAERVVLAAFHPDDARWAREAAEDLGVPWEDLSADPVSAVERFASFRFALCGRYHAAVLAVVQGMGWLGLDRDGRLTGFARYLGGGPVLAWEELLRHPARIGRSVRGVLRRRPRALADLRTLRRDIRAVLRRFRTLLEEER